MKAFYYFSALVLLFNLASAATINVPGDYPDIQSAVDAAGANDLIVVEPGEYFENINFKGKNIVLMSRCGASKTFIRGRVKESVVTFNSNEQSDSVLRGFTISGGKGTFYGSGRTGGAILCVNASPLIKDNIITKNAAQYGGGIGCVSSSSPKIIQNSIIENTMWSSYGSGGGIYCKDSSPTILNNRIVSNTGLGDYGQGGGISCDTASPVIQNNIIQGNTCKGDGGGVYCAMNSSPLLQGNQIFENACTTLGDGGGVWCYYYSEPVLINNAIHNNSAEEGGGLGFSLHSNAQVQNCIIFNNECKKEGGGIYCDGSGPAFQNVTITGNSAKEAGGFYARGMSYPSVSCSIIWGNKAQSHNNVFSPSGSITISYSDIGGGATGIGNMDQDPLFLSVSLKNFRLKQQPCQPSAQSPCVDAGDPNVLLYHGSTRSDGQVDVNVVDMGYHYPVVIQVPKNSATIQAAIDMAMDGDLILVGPGSYKENLSFSGKAIELRSDLDGDPNTYDIDPSAVLIEGNVTFDSGEEQNSILDGFTVTNGAKARGGGVYCYDASPVLKNLHVSSNTATWGGGIYAELSTLTIKDCLVEGNNAVNGGGLCLLSTSPEMTGCRFYSNQAIKGGGVYYDSGYILAINLLLWNNTAHEGGGYYCLSGISNLKNQTLYQNSATQKGGAFYFNNDNGCVRNSILWKNTAPNGPVVYQTNSTPSIYYSDVEGGWPGNGNLNQDPLFADPVNGDFALQQDPCQPGVINALVDGGQPTSGMIKGSTRTDLFQDKQVVDMGFHYPTDDLIEVPQEVPSIQEAIDIAENGDTILVSPGTFTETLDFKGKAIVVKSVQGPETTIINAAGAGSGVTLNNQEGPDSVFDGFTVMNGTGTLFDTGGSMNLCGGALLCGPGCNPILRNNIFINNSAEFGGGIFCYKCAPLISDNIFQSNTGGGALNEGGGLYCAHNSPTIINNSFITNEALNGAGIACRSEACPRIENNLFYKNISIKWGGGVYCYSDSNAKIIGNHAMENESGYGGFAWIRNASAQVSQNYIYKNHCKTSAGGLGFLDHSNSVVEDNLILENSSDFMGGGVYVSFESDVVIRNNVVLKNQAAAYGAGLYVSGSNADVLNNTICQNSGASKGGGVFASYKAKVVVTNTILWDNSAVIGPEIYLEELGGNISKLWISYSDLKGGASSVYVAPGCQYFPGAGMLDADPLFADLINYDVHLPFTSPCRQAGTNNAINFPHHDFEKDPRIAHGTVDMGADEFHTHLYLSGDFSPGGQVNVHIVGDPGSLAGLWISPNVTEIPLTSDWGDWYLSTPLFGPFVFPSLPANGLISLAGSIPQTPAGPYALALQALVGSKLTNLCWLEVE